MRLLTHILFALGLTLSLSANAQPLDSILARAVEHNPELKSLRLKFEAEAMRADQVNQLPDTQFGLGIPILPTETRLGPQVMMVNANQMFPWFGTFKAKENVAISMSKVAFEKIKAEQIMLFNELKKAYYSIHFLDQKKTIVQDILEQLQAMKRISLSSVEAGMTSSANVLRIQLKINEFTQQLQKIELEKKKEAAVINGLTQQNWDNVITTELTNRFPVIAFDRDSLESIINTSYPLIRMLDEQNISSELRLEVNDKMGAPKIGVGLDYMMINPRTDLNPKYNGRDVLIPKLMVTVPLQRKTFKAKEQEERFIQKSIHFSKEQLKSDLITQLIQHKANYDDALLDYELYGKQIETSKLAYNILLKDYSASGNGFDDLLEVQMQLLNYQLAREESVLAGRISVANIEQLTDL